MSKMSKASFVTRRTCQGQPRSATLCKQSSPRLLARDTAQGAYVVCAVVPNPHHELAKVKRPRTVHVQDTKDSL